MSDLKKIPQVSKEQCSKSHTDRESVRLVSDSGGGKNPIKLNRQKPKITKIRVATYNIRTMSAPEHLTRLEEELKHIKWDVLGLCETRLPGEKATVLKSSHILYQNNRDDGGGHGGVAFLVNGRAGHRVSKFCSVSDRVICMVLRLNKRYTVQLIHGYAPTSGSDDEEMEAFLENISRALELEKSHYRIISGDFNAKVGQKQATDPDNIGSFGLGARNQRGEVLVSYLSRENLYCLNTFFKKPKQRK